MRAGLIVRGACCGDEGGQAPHQIQPVVERVIRNAAVLLRVDDGQQALRILCVNSTEVGEHLEELRGRHIASRARVILSEHAPGGGRQGADVGVGCGGRRVCVYVVGLDERQGGSVPRQARRGAAHTADLNVSCDARSECPRA